MYARTTFPHHPILAHAHAHARTFAPRPSSPTPPPPHHRTPHQTWLTNSRIVHAKADTLSLKTAFTFSEATLPVWAHNAAPVRAPKTHAPCPGCYYLFHIGSGSTTKSVANCSVSARDSAQLTTAETLREMHGRGNVYALPADASSGLLHRSKTPEGPFMWQSESERDRERERETDRHTRTHTHTGTGTGTGTGTDTHSQTHTHKHTTSAVPIYIYVCMYVCIYIYI